MLEYDLSMFQPSVVDLLLYVQLLVNSNKTVGTIKNYLSGAKLYILEHGGSPAAFSHHMLINFIKGISRRTSHVPRQAVALPTAIMVRSCVVLRSLSVEGEIIAAAVLFAFTTMLRQCHLFYTPHGYMHLIRRGDVRDNGETFLISVRSSKTTGATHLSVIPVHAVPHSAACPVQALRSALALVPAAPSDPIFLDPNTRRPFGAAHANLLLKWALTSIGFAGASSASFHSLRRSSAQACVRAGLPLEEVQSHGLWRSSAINSYVPRQLRCMSQAIKHRLANNA